MSRFFEKLRNLLTKNLWITGSVGLAVAGLSCFAIFYFRPVTKEISKAELQKLVQSKAIKDGRAAPTPYAGIFAIEGKRKVKEQTQIFYVSTHFEDYEIRQLLESGQIKLDLPGQGMRAQWVNIVSTLLIGGLVIMLVVYQSSIGKGRNTHVRDRPTIAFRDVAGIEEAKGEVTELV